MLDLQPNRLPSFQVLNPRCPATFRVVVRWANLLSHAINLELQVDVRQ
jgi:hypothetical protein